MPPFLGRPAEACTRKPDNIGFYRSMINNIFNSGRGICAYLVNILKQWLFLWKLNFPGFEKTRIK
jgi:hypothetical protein